MRGSRGPALGVEISNDEERFLGVEGNDPSTFQSVESSDKDGCSTCVPCPTRPVGRGWCLWERGSSDTCTWDEFSCLSFDTEAISSLFRPNLNWNFPLFMLFLRKAKLPHPADHWQDTDDSESTNLILSFISGTDECSWSISSSFFSSASSSELGINGRPLKSDAFSSSTFRVTGHTATSDRKSALERAAMLSLDRNEEETSSGNSSNSSLSKSEGAIESFTHSLRFTCRPFGSFGLANLCSATVTETPSIDLRFGNL